MTGPLAQPVGIDTNRRRAASDGHHLSQCHSRSDLGHRLLTSEYHVWSRPRQEPAGEFFFADIRPSRREQLEQRTRTKQVQVLGVKVVFVDEARAWRTRADPTIPDSGQPTFVVRDSP